MNKYIVKEIYEADFGCEGLPDGQCPKVIVHLEDESGKKLSMQMDDEWLVEQSIDE